MMICQIAMVLWRASDRCCEGCAACQDAAHCFLVWGMPLLMSKPVGTQVAHTDVTLDDVWSLDLMKLNGWRCVKENTEGDEAFVDEDWETDEGEEQDEDSEDQSD